MASARKVSNQLLMNVVEVAAYYNIESMFDSCAEHISNLPVPESFSNRLKIYYFQLALRSLSYGDNFLELYNSFNELEQHLFESSTQNGMDNFRWLHGRRLLIVQIALSFLAKSLKMICSSTPSTPQEISIPSHFDFTKYSRDIKELLRDKYDDYEGRQFDEDDLEANYEQDLNHFTKDLLHGDNKKKAIHPMKVFELFSSHSLENTCHYLSSLINDAEDLVLGVPDIAFVPGQTQGADGMEYDDSQDTAAPYNTKDSVSSEEVKVTRSTRRSNQALASSQSSSGSSEPAPVAAPAPKTTRNAAAASSSKAPSQGGKVKVKANASPAVVGPITAASEKLKRKYDSIDPLQDALGGAGASSSSKAATASTAQSKKKSRRNRADEEDEMDIDEDEDEEEFFKPATRSSKTAPSTSAIVTNKAKVTSKSASSSSSKVPVVAEKAKTKSPAPAPVAASNKDNKGRRLTDSRPSGKKVSPIKDADLDDDDENTDPNDDKIKDTTSSDSDEDISAAMTMIKKSTKPRETSKKSPLPEKLGSSKSPMRSPVGANGNRNVHFGIRVRKRWTAEEIDALNRGIHKHGQGSWTAILEDPQFSSILKNRTNVDLKDKDRNLRKNE